MFVKVLVESVGGRGGLDLLHQHTNRLFKCDEILSEWYCLMHKYLNREYLAPQIRSMNNRLYSQAKLHWSYGYLLANHIATNKSSAAREIPLFPRLYPSFGYRWKIFPPMGLKYSVLALLNGTRQYGTLVTVKALRFLMCSILCTWLTA